MKILHLNTYDAGGSARAAWRFHLSFKEAGHESKLLVFKKKEADDVDIIALRLSFLQKLRHYYNEIQRRITRRNIKKEYYFYNINEKIGIPTEWVIKSLPFNPDIICVHWVSAFVNARNIHELSKATGAPVIWRFNDLNAFTGGCHYSNACTNYTSGCGNCPALPNPSAHDRSRKNVQAKIHWLGKTNCCFVSSTTEIDEQLKSSAVAKACASKFIMLSCNSKFFVPDDKKKAASALGLSVNRKIIFFGANDMNDSRKGFKELIQSLGILKQQLSPEKQKEILLVFASNASFSEVEWPFEHVQLSFLKGEEQLSKAYQAATLFVSPSLEDAGPMMIAESMLCGTPVVAFDIGLASDAVINKVTGFIVPKWDVAKFAESIKDIVNMDDEGYKKISESCYDKALEMFSVSREVKEYESLFAERLKIKQHV